MWILFKNGYSITFRVLCMIIVTMTLSGCVSATEKTAGNKSLIETGVTEVPSSDNVLITPGQYFLADPGEDDGVVLPNIQLNKDGSFEFFYDTLSSYAPHGNYSIQEDLLEASSSDGKYDYYFRIIDDRTLEFIQEGSSDVSLTDQKIGSPVTDGAVFTLKE